MIKFIDIHTHILPGVDDGATDLEQSMQMIRIAYDNGTRAIVCTPHYRGKFKKNTPETLHTVFEQLKSQVMVEFKDMAIYLGSEIHYEIDAPSLLYNKKILALNDTNYCLLEFSTISSYNSIITGVSEMINYGFTPIVAHVERYNEMRKNKGLIDELKKMGALIQVNSDSILGKNGFGIKMYCNRILKEKKVDFVASDAHETTQRIPDLSESYNKVLKKEGEEYANKIFYENAEKVLKNEFV